MNNNESNLRKEIIDHYENIQTQIDVRTETLLMELPEALKNSRDELMARIKEEKEKNLAALADDSPLIQHKNEYYRQFVELKQEYANCGTDLAKKESIHNRLLELKKNVELIEEFLEDFKNRTLSFEEADRSVYSSLIGELVHAEENKKIDHNN
ncbi:hypothetical protein BpHYR1_042398 [Brachionus plicatilis]|uniref:Uncharacterized protein n=1 Tax=Brachionus plicatilis TaxID=10195 RepID=A0A3M7RJ11_BRAPC|nr:hypothetical protein BpHYR1_042398 [Brachionus plicatilis]